MLMRLYGFTGTLAFLATRWIAEVFALPGHDQSPLALFLVRAFGASQTLLALIDLWGTLFAHESDDGKKEE